MKREKVAKDNKEGVAFSKRRLQATQAARCKSDTSFQDYKSCRGGAGAIGLFDHNLLTTTVPAPGVAAKHIRKSRTGHVIGLRLHRLNIFKSLT